jgi:hypothetical protein
MQDRRRKLASLSAIGRRACAPPWRGTECHSAQGLVQYLNQLTGNLRKPDGTAIVGSFPGNLIDPGSATLADASVAYMQSLGITPDKVQPQTCQACHDPHTTALRVEGDTPMLPSGFQVRGAGSGAICFVCHDSRNGARGDQFNGVYTNNDNPGTPAPVTSIGAPHEADQGDVVAGRNAFFVPIYSPSPHLAVQDACVGCHMKNPVRSPTARRRSWSPRSRPATRSPARDVDVVARRPEPPAAVPLPLAAHPAISAPLVMALEARRRTSAMVAVVVDAVRRRLAVIADGLALGVAAVAVGRRHAAGQPKGHQGRNDESSHDMPPAERKSSRHATRNHPTS